MGRFPVALSHYFDLPFSSSLLLGSVRSRGSNEHSASSSSKSSSPARRRPGSQGTLWSVEVQSVAEIASGPGNHARTCLADRVLPSAAEIAGIESCRSASQRRQSYNRVLCQYALSEVLLALPTRDGIGLLWWLLYELRTFGNGPNAPLVLAAALMGEQLVIYLFLVNRRAMCPDASCAGTCAVIRTRHSRSILFGSRDSLGTRSPVLGRPSFIRSSCCFQLPPSHLL